MKEEKNTLNSETMSWIVIVFLGLTLFATNPNEIQFKEFLNTDLKSQGYKDGGISGGIISLFSRPTSWLLSLSTERKDYVFISVYNVSVLGDEHVYVGVFNHFIKVR
jgi:hypothetical protein